MADDPIEMERHHVCEGEARVARQAEIVSELSPATALHVRAIAIHVLALFRQALALSRDRLAEMEKTRSMSPAAHH
jgi:hypothetical protein